MRKLLLGLVLLTAMAIRAVASATSGRASRVKFVTPGADATTGPKVTFTVELRNFELDAKDVGEMKGTHMGHLHFSMDNGGYDYPEYSGANGKLAAILGTAGKYSPAVAPTITYSNLPKGKHRLLVMLANNDHSPAGPEASVTFTVE